jgi:hemolysin activation/secretion protein
MIVLKGMLPKQIAVSVTMLLSAGMAVAEVLPGAATPDQVSRQLTTERPKFQETAVAPIQEPKQPGPSPLMAQAAKIKFQLNGVVLEGNHVFTTQELSPIYTGSLHKTISVADLFTIVQNITNYYRNSGYIISRAILPPQHVKGGVVHIQIVEGFIGAVSVSGHPKGAKCLVQAFGKRIAERRPLELARMEKYLTLANEIPATQVKAVLSPSKSEPGAADLTLVTENRLLSGYVSYDNYGTLYIGPQQMTANLGLNSLIGSGDSTQITFTKTPRGGELTYTDINYSGPLDTYGERWMIGGTRAHTHPLFVLQSQQVDGVNLNYYTNIQFPVIRTRTKTLTIQTSFNYLDSAVNNFGNLELYTDHLRSVGLSAIYNFADSWYGANLMSGEVRQGLPLFGYSSDYNPDTATTSRPGGRGDYTKFTVGLSRLQAVKGPFSLYGIARGQWAFNPLLASEQFAYGGSQLGRGYDIAEIIGDKGAAASVEARYDWALERFYLQNIQFYLFYDGGAIWNFKNIGGTPTKQTALSTGGGARFYMTRWVSGNIMWAQPLTKQVSALQATSQFVSGGITTNRGNGAAPRVFFSIVAQMD